MSYIFLSHSTQDNDFTRELAERLAQFGFDVWVDFDNIGSGERWVLSIQNAVENCVAVVVVMSKSARDSEWVERETLLAMDLKKPIHIALIDDIPLPLHLINRQFTGFQEKQESSYKLLADALWAMDLVSAAPRKVPDTLSPQPDRANFFDYIEQLPGGERNGLVARDLFKWVQGIADRVEFGGKVTPGYHARLDVAGNDLTVFSLWAYPKQPAVQIQFQYLMDYPPYDNPGLRRSTLRSLNRLLDDTLIEDKADRRPTFPLATAFNTADKIEMFKGVIQEIVDNLRGQ